METAHLNGTDISYEVRGSGPPCLAIHGGLGMDHQYLKATFGSLEDRLTMIYYDQRGNGRSGRPPIKTLTMEQLADDAASLLQHVGGGPAVVLGHSYGGFVAQELALRHSELLSGLVLVDTTPGQLGAGEREDELEQGPPLPQAMVALMSAAPQSDAEMGEMMTAMLPYYFHRVPEQEASVLLDGAVLSASAMIRGFEVLGGWSSIDRLHEINVPSLLLWGRHDLVCSAPQGKRIASRIRDSELHYFEESGHFPWVEEPDAFFATLSEWLSREGLCA